MSKFLKINEMQISSQDLLVATLGNDMKFLGKTGASAFVVESHDTPAHLFGYCDDQRPETAEVIVRRQFLGGMANDMGFKRQESGNFAPIISAYDSHTYNQVWQDQLSQRYAERKYEQDMYHNGFSLASKEIQADGTTAMTFTAMGGL